MKIQTQIDIACEPAVVFPWIAEPEKAMQWQRGISTTEIIKETPDVIGTTFTETMEGGRKSLKVHGTVTQYVPHRTIAFHLSSRVHELDASYQVEGDEDGSKLTVVADIKWKFPTSIICRISSKKIQKGIWLQTQAELAELKRLCEEAAPQE